jgi:hypothetical protein
VTPYPFDPHTAPLVPPQGEELIAFEETVLELVSDAFLMRPSALSVPSRYNWPDDGSPIMASVGLRGEFPNSECAFCYRTTKAPGRPRVMTRPLWVLDESGVVEEPAFFASYVYNDFQMGELKPVDLADAGDLSGVRWSRRSSARRPGARSATDPSVLNVYASLSDPALLDRALAESNRPDSPFEFVAWSEPRSGPAHEFDEAWVAIEPASVFVAYCGAGAHRNPALLEEIEIAHAQFKPCIYVSPESQLTKPPTALDWERIFAWTWESLLNSLANHGSPRAWPPATQA